MDIELIKENVLPLKNGRKIETLTAVLNMGSEELRKRDEIKLDYENRLKDSKDDEMLEIYYNYINWIEQNYPNGGKEGNLVRISEKCLHLFYNQEKYQNNEKLLSIFLKFAAHVNKPLDYFQLFYKSGFGKRLSQFYISWSFYYENQNNFQKALKIIHGGIHNNAQPKDDLTKALNDLEVRTMRHAMSNPEESESANQRKALNNLKIKVTGGKADAPVNREKAVSQSSALKKPANKLNNTESNQIFIFCDENESQTNRVSATPLMELKTSDETQENKRDPGKWNENKLKVKSQIARQVNCFEILEDPVESTEQKTANSKPNKEIKKCQTKETIVEVKTTTVKPWNRPTSMNFPVAKFEALEDMKKYIWFDLKNQMYRNNTEYSFEELRAEKWFKEKKKCKELESVVQEEKITDKQLEKSLADTTTCYTLNKTDAVRELFFNGSVSVDQSQSIFVLNEKKNDSIKVNNFEIFSDTTKLDNTINNDNDENKTLNNDQFNSECNEFTIFGIKEKDSSTPCKSGFKVPLSRAQFKNHPNFVTGITAKLETINEVSRESQSSKSSSSSSGMSTTGGNNTAIKFSLPEQFNPFESEIKIQLLKSLSDPVEFRMGFASFKTPFPEITTKSNFVYGLNEFVILRPIASSLKWKMFHSLISPDQNYILKVCDAACNWDFYIRDELERRFKKSFHSRVKMSTSIIPNETLFYKNGFISIEKINFPTLGNLEQAVDYFKKNDQSFPKILLNYVILELILWIQELHEQKIIHGDINLKNILLISKRIERKFIGKTIQALHLTDFSNSIDIAILPEKTTFNTNYTKYENFSILDSKNWTFLVDWLGFLNCIHLICFGKDMKPINDNGTWKIEYNDELMQQKHLKKLSDILLNLEANQKPELNSLIESLTLELKEKDIELNIEFAHLGLIVFA